MPDFSDAMSLTPEDMLAIQNYQSPQLQSVAPQVGPQLPGDFTPMDVPSWAQNLPAYALNQPVASVQQTPYSAIPGLFDAPSSTPPMSLTPEEIATIQNYQSPVAPQTGMPTFGYPSFPTLPDSAYAPLNSEGPFGVDNILWAGGGQAPVFASPTALNSPTGAGIVTLGLTPEQAQNLDIMAMKLTNGVFANSSAAPILAIYGITSQQALAYLQQTNPVAAGILASNLGLALQTQPSVTVPGNLMLTQQGSGAVSTQTSSDQKARLTQLVSYILVPGALVAFAIFMAYRATKADEANSRPRPPVYIPERRYEEERKVKRNRKK